MNRPGSFRRLIVCGLLWTLPAAFAANPLDEDYNQWKAALGTNTATPAERITSLPGFRVELIHSAARHEGSWVAMTFDPKGRVVIAREDRGLLRLSLADQSSASPAIEVINTNLLECRGLLYAHGSLYANANNAKAFVRLRDTDGDDQFDEVKVLRNTPGGVGHGRNQLALGPDGMIYSIHGDDVGLPSSGATPKSPLKHYAEDRLLPCEWDRHLFNADARMPFGHLIRTDATGEQWELVAGGLRNPFGIDFNEAGDLFTFDADMEWDVGLSWYHPTRVLHLVPGGDYGWRRGTGVLPVWSPDTLPSAVDIGVSSPTAIKFGTRSNWPEPWKSALFIEDWSYGKIIAVHLQKHGGTYMGRTEIFLKGKPLNVTGLDFGPDGSLYFITGGRRTQSGLYRVSFTNTASLADSFHTEAKPLAKPTSWPPSTPPGPLWDRLANTDHWIRYDARLELESQPVADWSQRALTESNATAALTALLALSRAGDEAHRSRILQRWAELTVSTLLPEQQLLAIRAVSVCFLRLGKPSAEEARKVQRVLDPLYPSTDSRVNQSLCELLVYVGATNVVSKTIPLLAAAATQEEKFHYLFTLRTVTNGWSLADRDTYFSWLGRARREFNGANMLPTALNYIRADAESTLTAEERTRLAPALAVLEKPATADLPPPVSRSFVRDWSMQDLVPDLSRVGQTRNAARGKRLFAETGCLQCHRLGNEGGFIGPDLTSVSSRFDRRALLESIVEPSRVVSETYRSVTLTLKSGAIHDGRIVSEDPVSLLLAINPVDPDQRRRIAKSDIANTRVSDISPMPAGLLNTLNPDEILDLLAWVESGGTAIQAKSAGRAQE